MKKLAVFSIFFCLFTANSYCADPFDEFFNQLTGISAEQVQKNLDNLAKDLGGLLGGGSFRSGKNLGLPGFDVGVRVPVVKVRDEDAIIKAAKLDILPLPILQAELGLPYGIDLIVRYTSYATSNMMGFGVRYLVLDSWIPGVPFVSVQSVYNSLSVDTGANKFKASTLSSALVASWRLVVIEPYVGISYDMTGVDPDSALNLGKTGSANSIRIDGGVSLSLIPLTYLQLGVTSAEGSMGYTFGLGVKF